MKKVDDLPLSTRAKRCLTDAGYMTVKQVVEASDAQLLRIPDFGRGTLREVRELAQALIEPEPDSIGAREIRMECLRLANLRPDVSSPQLIIQAAKEFASFVLGSPTHQGE